MEKFHFTWIGHLWKLDFEDFNVSLIEESHQSTVTWPWGTIKVGQERGGAMEVSGVLDH